MLSSGSLNIYKSSFRLTDENKKNPKVLDLRDLDILASDFLISGFDINTKIKQLSFKDSRGVALKNLQTEFSYTPSRMVFSDLHIETLASLVMVSFSLITNGKILNPFQKRFKFQVFLKIAI